MILLHGWGANHQDLLSLGKALDLPHCQFLFPNAPYSHPQVPGGRSWYDLQSETYDGIDASRTQLLEWLLGLGDSLGLPCDRLVLAGFSQGGAMALDVGVNSHLPLAAIASLSGYLHFQPQPPQDNAPPIFMVHGEQDRVIPLAMAHHSRDALIQMGYGVEGHDLPMGHEISQQALILLRDFLLKNIPQTPGVE